jgi:hypothetical protein
MGAQQSAIEDGGLLLPEIRCMPWDKERRCRSAILLRQPLLHPPPKPAASRFAIAFRYWSHSFAA